MAYKISGVVLSIGPTQNVTTRSGNPFAKRDLVITVMKFDPYTGIPTTDDGNTPKFTFMQERCQLLDNLSIGDRVTVHFDIAGRSYVKDGKQEYMTDLRPFRLDVMKQQLAPQPSNPFTQPPTPPTSQTVPTEAQIGSQPVSDDDLPF